ncbi:MAG: hypothetical protein MPI95_00940 [Nitrosopumilus sp.]|nr:hypothetical protein [Nitrosopumilus sp.]CAI9832099.1 conserved hypothetical protein [Nitrosopumilaceae archaeon]MDA7941402.1 hypothetical protein [Nitrosopumilus sp.]MDA7942810.1 hypothetical protein [Nitrosopumilus sp.]MDA7945096.1 hypothetical protein [Nitrosopumilus sp.]
MAGDTKRPKRTCKGECKEFRVRRPVDGRRYWAGQARCQICEIWLDYRGCHLRDGVDAVPGSEGWFCNCCNYRVRRRPRNVAYKSMLRPRPGGDIDTDHFNNHRARLLKRLASGEIRDGSGAIEAEFGCSAEDLLRIAESGRRSKVAMVVEFERLRAEVGRVPTPRDLDRLSRFKAAEYESEFGSIGHMLNRLGYDPWYGRAVRRRAR